MKHLNTWFMCQNKVNHQISAMKALKVLTLFLISLANICNSVRVSKPRTIVQPQCICNKCSEGNISKCLLNLNKNVCLGLAWKRLEIQERPLVGLIYYGGPGFDNLNNSLTVHVIFKVRYNQIYQLKTDLN